ncbi:MAG: hypothetical protein QNJ45_22185 [Ardenticatenaceae bacterium]|nr:hypothetical protein [Ardenticatenaceae bacterium]
MNRRDFFAGASHIALAACIPSLPNFSPKGASSRLRVAEDGRIIARLNDSQQESTFFGRDIHVVRVADYERFALAQLDHQGRRFWLYTTDLKNWTTRMPRLVRLMTGIR